MCRNYSSSYNRRGLTLIEVAAALAILSTLLVGMLVIFRKNADRIDRALDVRLAVCGTDALLRKWSEQGVYPPVPAEGDLPEVEGFVWKTRVHSRKYRRTLGLDIVELEVFQDETGSTSKPVVTVQLPIPATMRRSPKESSS